VSEWAYTVIGTNVVIDCETVEEAVAYMDRLAATPAPLMSKGEADARIDLMKMTKQRDDLLEALAATPAPLDVLVAARAVVDAWEETVTATVISRTNWAIERLRYALAATPAPLDDDGWQERGNPGDDATPAPLALCGASFDEFTCNRGAGHDGDHKDMNGTGGLVGWRNATPAPLDVLVAALTAERDEAQMEYADACMFMDEQREKIAALQAEVARLPPMLIAVYRRDGDIYVFEGYER